MDQIAQLRSALAGRYEIDREIGAGGMATVYLARDAKHDRNVALKVLKPELGAVLGVERFLSEIRVTAHLQHPNLLPLFDSGEANGLLFYVMPFVEGETLRARLEREHQLPVDEAVRISTSIASALAHAHAQGVIHRDLKPENILMQSGQPVISDFGIALAVSNAGGTRVTQTGISLGTPQYMSPEQAAGDRTIDARSDIYSLGAITYEMLAGTPPHAGGSAQAVIAKLMTADPPPLLGLRSTTPVLVARAVEKALSRTPADRFTSAERFGDALHSGMTAAVESNPRANRRVATRAWLQHPATLVLLALTVFLVGAIGWTRTHSTPPSTDAVRFTMNLPKGAQLVGVGLGALASVSPDGRAIVYVGESPSGRQLWLREMDQIAPRPLQGTDNAAIPQFTPDGSSITFLEGLTFLYRVLPLSGGGLSTLFADASVGGLAWTRDDSILTSGGRSNIDSRLLRVPAGGGKPVAFNAKDSATTKSGQRQPMIAPDGKTVFFTIGSQAGGLGDEIGVTTMDKRVIMRTTLSGTQALGYNDGRLYYVQQDGAVMAVPFDLRKLHTAGQSIATGDIVTMDARGARASLSSTGHLAFVAGSARKLPVVVGANGSTAAFNVTEREFDWPRYSPNGRDVAFTIAERGRSDIWIYHVGTGTFERLTTDGTTNDRPEWWPDGRSVIYRSNRAGDFAFWRQPADGSGKAERLTPALDVPVQEVVVTPDGKTMLLRVDTRKQARDILTMPVGGTQPQVFVGSAFDELTPRISPDGKWVAYTSNESGRDEIYIRALPGPGGRVLISDGGGSEPIWSRDGKKVYYRRGQDISAASVTLGKEVTVTSRTPILSGSYAVNRLHPSYDVAPDGRLLMLRDSEGELQLTVVLNWAQAMRQRLGPVK